MDAKRLLEDLRQRGLQVETEGNELRVRPRAALTNTLRTLIREHRDALRVLVAAKNAHYPEPGPKPAADAPPADGWSFEIVWARERGWLLLRDPATGEWHAVRAIDCPHHWREIASAHRARDRLPPERRN